MTYQRFHHHTITAIDHMTFWCSTLIMSARTVFNSRCPKHLRTKSTQLSTQPMYSPAFGSFVITFHTYIVHSNVSTKLLQILPIFLLQINMLLNINQKTYSRKADQQLRVKQEVKVIWQKAPIPRLGVTPGGRKLYHWIPGVVFPISVP